MARRSTKRVRDMVLSMAVVAAPIAVLFALASPTSTNPVHVVDYSVTEQQATVSAPFPLEAPVGLPSGWRATSATYTGGRAADWHLGYVTPHTRYTDLEQINGSSKPVLAVQAPGASAAGTVVINGQTWRHYAGGGHQALVRDEPGDTVIVAGSADLAELRRFAASLRARHRETAPSTSATTAPSQVSASPR